MVKEMELLLYYTYSNSTISFYLCDVYCRW